MPLLSLVLLKSFTYRSGCKVPFCCMGFELSNILLLVHITFGSIAKLDLFFNQESSLPYVLSLHFGQMISKLDPSPAFNNLYPQTGQTV